MLVFFTATTGAGIVTADFHGCHLISNNSENESPIDYFESECPLPAPGVSGPGHLDAGFGLGITRITKQIDPQNEQ